MKKLPVLLAILAMGIAGSLKLYSQETPTLYRGRLPYYYNYKYNGTPFWQSKNFQKGDIFYNGKLYKGVLMNIDAFHQEVQVREDILSTPIIIYTEQVAWLKIGKQFFVNLRYLGYEDAPVGFFEVDADGKSEAYVHQVLKTFRSSTTSVNGDPIGYEDPDYDYNVTNYFAYKVKYYEVSESEVKSVKKKYFNRRVNYLYEDEDSFFGDIVWHSSESGNGMLEVASIPVRGTALPQGYFSEDDTSEDDIYSGSGQTATYRNKLYVIGKESEGNSAVVSGKIYDFETGDPLHGALVHEEKTSVYSRTSKDGSYSIELPKGEYFLHFNYESKEEMVLRVLVQGNGELNVELNEQVTVLKGAIISSSSKESHRTTAMGVENVSMKTIGKIPSAFGEGDVIRAVLTLPGVKSSGEAAGGINVRGGSTGENLILFNDNTIYNPSHLFGIFSSFNPDIVEGVELFKGTVPAEFGGRISSVMNVRSKEGARDKFKGSLGIGVLTSRAHFELPLFNGKTTVIGGFRTTYSDWILKRLPTDSHYSGSTAGFTDANLGITHRFSYNDQLRLSGYFARDYFSMENNLNIRYGNINASAIYTHKMDEGGSLYFSTGYDNYLSTTGDRSWKEGAYDLTTRINQVFLKGVWKQPFGNHLLSAGANAVGYILSPGSIAPYGDSDVISSTMDPELGVEPSLFVSDTFKPFDGPVSLEGGIRLSSFLRQGMTPSMYPEFRLSAKYTPVEIFSVKLGFDTMSQYIHLISNTSGISPTDTWRLSSADIHPMTGWQGAAGVYYTWVGAGLDFSAETYWKQTSYGLDYKAGANLSMNPNLADELVPVYGKAYGVELMVKKPAGQLTGWMSYTWSRSQLREMQDRGLETIEDGNWYNAPYDKPHEFKFVGNYAITHRYSVSMNIDYSTGRPVSVPSGKYLYNGVWRMAYLGRNNHRIPDYFRVDAALNIDPGHYLKAIAHTSITIGVYNVLGRKNAYSVYFNPASNGRPMGYMLSVFATQVPYINLNILF